MGRNRVAYLGFVRFDLSLKGVKRLVTEVFRHLEEEQHAIHRFVSQVRFGSAETFIDDGRVYLVLESFEDRWIALVYVGVEALEHFFHRARIRLLDVFGPQACVVVHDLVVGAGLKFADDAVELFKGALPSCPRFAHQALVKRLVVVGAGLS